MSNMLFTYIPYNHLLSTYFCHVIGSLKCCRLDLCFDAILAVYIFEFRFGFYNAINGYFTKPIQPLVKKQLGESCVIGRNQISQGISS